MSCSRMSCLSASGIMTCLPLNRTPSEIPISSRYDQYGRRSCGNSLIVAGVMFMCALTTYTVTPYDKLSSRHRDINTRSVFSFMRIVVVCSLTGYSLEMRRIPGNSMI